MPRTVRVRGIIPQGGRYLFVKHAPVSDYWALPGGRLEAGEALEDGLSREIIEELGVEPVIAELLYIQQLFIGDEESLEFFFLIINGHEYGNVDLAITTHGSQELSMVAFIDPKVEHVLPEFLGQLNLDMQAAVWPKLFVRRQSRDLIS